MTLHDPYNAFCRHTHVELPGAPEGPRRGSTFAVKDVFDIAGHRTGNGNPVWLETHASAPRTASAVERLLAAGARMLGDLHRRDGVQPQRRERALRHAEQSARAGPDSRRVVERIGGRGCRQPGGFRARHRLRRLGSSAGELLRDFRHPHHARPRPLGLLSIAGLASLPQVTLPLAEMGGCPLGLSLIAPSGRDRGLLEWVAKARS
jgi:hypothetical protein